MRAQESDDGWGTLVSLVVTAAARPGERWIARSAARAVLRNPKNKKQQFRTQHMVYDLKLGLKHETWSHLQVADHVLS